MAWDLAKSVYKLKNKDKATFYSPIEAKETKEMIAAPAPTSTSPPPSLPPLPHLHPPKEREFVVDSGASMHMLSKRDLRSDVMDTLRRSRIPTTVVTANGEVQTNDEAQIYVHDLDLFVTVQILDDTPAVLSPGKLRDEQGYTYERVNSKQPRWTKQGKNILCKTEKFRTNGRSWIIEFIFHIATTGLVKYIDKYIIKSSFVAK